MGGYWPSPDYLTEGDTTDLEYPARHVKSSEWVTPTPNPVPTALEVVQCPPHIWTIGLVGTATTCRKCKVEKSPKVTFRGYEQTPERQRVNSLRMRASPR